ncbi:34910_t:CDS:1, partial [Racocetra persica]
TQIYTNGEAKNADYNIININNISLSNSSIFILDSYTFEDKQLRSLDHSRIKSNNQITNAHIDEQVETDNTFNRPIQPSTDLVSHSF